MLDDEVLKELTLDDIIVYLLDLKEKGISVTHKIGDYELSSDTISWDNAYKEFFGMTKQEYDAEFASQLISKRCKYSPEEIQVMYERGIIVIPKKKHSDWRNCVIERTSGTAYGGDDLAVALNLMEILANNEQTVDEAVQLYKGVSDNNDFNDKIRSIVFRFADRGPDFYTKSTRSPLNAEQVIEIEKQRQENFAMFAKGNI